MAFAFKDLTPDYGDVEGEVSACRTHCALFDFSFLERVRVEGREAQNTIEMLIKRSLETLRKGQIRYAVRVGSTGKLLADLTVWRTGEQTFEVMSGRRQDVVDVLRLSTNGCRITDLTAKTAVFALQGPRALYALRELAKLEQIEALRYFSFCEARVAGLDCTVGRLGYTGEQGFEIVLARERRADLWTALAKRARPAGFAAADILRIEAGFVLFANEFAVPVSPSEAGLARFFEGIEVLRHPPVRLICFRAASDVKPKLWRPDCEITRPDGPGTITVTSACESIAAGNVLGMGYIEATDIRADQPLHDGAGVFRDIRPTPLPFYDFQKRRPRAAWSL